MKLPIFLVALSLLFACRHSAPRDRNSSAERDILATDDARIAAAKNSDADALDAIYANEFRLITQTGVVRTKRDQVDEYRSRRIRYVSFELLERDVKVFGTTAIVWSRERSVIRRDGQDVGGDRRVTRVYVHRDGRWQLVTSHASAVE